MLPIRLHIAYTEQINMAKVNFTLTRINDYQCEAGKSQSFLWDTGAPGLGLRATVNGSKAYIFQAKINGKEPRMTIGDPVTWRLQDAREKARLYKVMVDNGQDPRDVIAAELSTNQASKAEAKRKTITFGEVWNVYLAERKSRWGERHYQDHISKASPGGIPCTRGTRGRGVTTAGPLNYFMSIPMNTIDNKMVEMWAERESLTRPTSARLAWRMLKVFFQWCYESDAYANLLQAMNPAKTKKSGESLGKANAKRDNLELAQLPGWFDAVQRIANRTISVYLQTLLLTGARPGEVLQLRWADIDWQWNSIVIRDKIDGTRTIPLTPYVAQILTALPHHNDFVFASTKAGVSMIGKPHQAHIRACGGAGLQGLTLHGLRRSFASLAEQTDTPGGVAAQIQGHKPQSAREKSYIVRPMDMLRTWHGRIESWILKQANVEWNPSN